MEFSSFALGSLETNCFLIHDDKEAVVIDPGGDPAVVLDYLKSHRLKLTHILNTHLHFDHIGGNAALQKATGAVIMANSRDAFMLNSSLGRGGMYGAPATAEFSFENLDESQLVLAGSACQVLATPGHSPGSLSFYFPAENVVFCGDVLFYRSVGRADFEGGDPAVLQKSINEKLYTLPESTVVCPGHGFETVIGDEIKHNPFNMLF